MGSTHYVREYKDEDVPGSVKTNQGGLSVTIRDFIASIY
jgi:hypothetical protein